MAGPIISRLPPEQELVPEQVILHAEAAGQVIVVGARLGAPPHELVPEHAISHGASVGHLSCECAQELAFMQRILHGIPLGHVMVLVQA